MKCANCGESINGTEVFCPYCGERLTGFGMNDDTDEDITQVDPVISAPPYDSMSNSVGKDLPYGGQNPAGDQRPFAGHYDEEQRNYGKRPYSENFTASSRQKSAAAAGPKKSPALLIAVLLVLLALLVLCSVYFFFIRNRVPEMEDMTCDDFYTEYGFSEDTDGDSVKEAYYNEVVIRFDEAEKSSSAYKVKATVYTPDMEEIYEKSTEQKEVADRLKRLSDDDLDHEQKLIIIDKKGVMTDGSADSLREMIEEKYMTAGEYSSQSASRSSGSQETPSSSQDPSGGSQADSPDREASRDESDASDESSSSAGSIPVITGVSATSTLYEKNYDHSPENICDGKLTTAWVEGVSGYGVNESITLRLPSGTLVSSMTINAGYQKSASLYAKNCRPQEITVIFSDGSSRSFVLKDVNAAQTLSLGQVVTDSVTVRIDSVYSGTKYQDTCISEISLN